MSTPIRTADILAEIERATRGDDRNLDINQAIDAFGRGVRHSLVLGLVAERLEIQGRQAEPISALAVVRVSMAALPGPERWRHARWVCRWS